MKKGYIYILIIFIVIQVQAQYNQDAPWMKELQNKSSKSKHTLAEISNAFDSYWINHKEDKDKKGSGYKPFKRWQNRWELSLNKEGYIINPNKIWKDWEDKNQMQRNANDISNWQNIGPFTQESKSGQGRVNTMIVDPNNPNTYYVGAPAGGIWKSINQGTTWIPLSDNLPQIGVSGIAIDHTNSNTIYIATGDDDANDTYSIGVLKSVNGGITWNTTGLLFGDSGYKSNEIYMHPYNNQILWVATSNGLYKTTNAGVTWSIKLNGNIRDLKIHPTNPNILYAVSSSQFYKSTDGGNSFSSISGGLPFSSNRLAIEVTLANPNIVYVLSANGSNGFQGLYKSTNSGNSFNQTSVSIDVFGGSSQSWYDMALTVSDTDENIVLVGVLDIFKSTNGGDDFSRLNYWYDASQASYTHADIHFLRYFNGDLFCGSDGGIYKSSNDGIVFDELNEGLAISQYYRIAGAKQTADNIVGGLQDNGGFAYSNDTWYKYHGGDGMDCAVDPNNPNTYYGFTQYGGSLSKTTNGGVSGQGVASSPETGNWITPLTINSQGELYAGYSRLYKLVGNSWQQISGNVFGGQLHRVEIDPNNEDIIYVGRYNDLYKSTDRGVNFTHIYSAFDTISSIEVNNDSSQLIYLTTSSGEDGQVLLSTTGGNSFTDITKNLPSESKLIIKHQPHSPLNDLYIGTSLGVYHISDSTPNWEVYSTNLPNVPIRDLEININDQVISAGTYGRSVWKSPIEVTAPNNDIRLMTINNPNNNYNCGTDLSPEITVKNNGQNLINQVNINYAIDGVPFNYVDNRNINTQDLQIITLPNISGLSLGEHQLSVDIIINNDAYNDNNSLAATFYVNQFDANPTAVNPFENIADAWLVTNSSIWQIAQPNTTILGSSNNTGYVTSANSNYPDNTSSYLISPCYDLSAVANPILKFDMAFDIEIDYDVLYMEYTTNNGETWTVLGTANDPNWYNSDYDAHILTIGKQWTGTDTTFKEYSYNLSSLTNESNIIFRFTFLSDQGVTNEGVLIDNFAIEGIILNTNERLLNEFTIHPNPSKGIYTFKRQSNIEMQISVFDITGKLVNSIENISALKYNLDLSNLDRGIYFAVISAGNTKITKKLILN